MSRAGDADRPDPVDAVRLLVLGDHPLEHHLDQVAKLGLEAIPAADCVSITLVDGDAAITAAATGDLALGLDERQYEAGHGPCLDSARRNTEFWIHDMSTETRWPDYTPRAVELGAGSSVSIPLPARDRIIGALNTYAAQPRAFDEPSIAAARVFADAAGVALRNAQVVTASIQLSAQLQQAMQSRAVIEQAKGIIMGDRRVDADQAFQILRSISQNANRKLRDVAQALVDSARAGR